MLNTKSQKIFCSYEWPNVNNLIINKLLSFNLYMYSTRMYVTKYIYYNLPVK